MYFSKDEILKIIHTDDIHFCERQFKCIISTEWSTTMSKCQIILSFIEEEAHLTSADETGSIPVTEKFTQLLHFNWIRLRITNENTVKDACRVHITAYSVH